MKVLVTGGAGFIGSHVVGRLICNRHDVVVLDDLSGGFPDNVDIEARLVVGSVTDEHLVASLFDEYQFDCVYHLAAYAAEGLSHFIRRFNYTNNVVGSVNIINECVKHDVKMLIYASSIAVYGHRAYDASEDCTPSPIDPYGIAKYAVELDLAAAREMWGLNYIVFRPHNVYGPRQSLGDRYRNVVGIFIRQCRESKPMTIFGNGNQARAFTYIDDLAVVLCEAMTRDDLAGNVFNVGSDVSCTVNDLAKLVASEMDVAFSAKNLPPRKEAVVATANHQKVYKVLPVKNTPLSDGIRRTVDWVRSHGYQDNYGRQVIEVEKNNPWR